MLELISQVADGLQILKAITDDRESENPKLDQLDDEIVGALREIYFTPTGTLSLLERLSQGQMPEISEVERVLPRFNDAEWRVGRALYRLDFANLSERREVSLRRARALEQLRYGKINVRRDVQQLLNYALTHRKPVDAGEATELLGRIRELNEQIEHLEEAHNFRARR